MYQLIFIGFEPGALDEVTHEIVKNKNIIVKVFSVSEYLHYTKNYLFSEVSDDLFLIVCCHSAKNKFSDYYKLVAILSGKANMVAVLSEYNKKNIRLAFLAGFQDVLGKEFSAHDISGVIQNLLGGRNAVEEFDIVKRTYQQDNKQTLDEKMLQLLISESENSRTLQKKRLLELRSMHQYKNFRIAVIKTDLPADDYIYNEYLTLNNQLLTILSQILDDCMSSGNGVVEYIATTARQNLCVLFFSKSENENEVFSEVRKRLQQDIIPEFCYRTDYCIRISLSSFYHKIENTEVAYRQALEAGYYHFYESAEHIHKRRINIYGQDADEYLSEDISSLAKTIIQNEHQYSITSFGEIFRSLSEVFSANSVQPKFAIKYVSTMFNKMIFDTIFVDYHTKMMMYFRHNIDMVLSMLSTFEKIGEYLSLMIDELLYSSSREQEGTDKLVLDVKRYISKYYNRQITLKDASEYVHINPNYLSDLFKKQTGRGFLTI